MADTHLLEPRKGKGVAMFKPLHSDSAGIAHAPAYQAFQILRAGFTVAPILAGADKFFHLMTDWDMYLATPVAKLLPFSAHTFMVIAGVVEIAAGILVALIPRIGAWVVSAWLLGIVINLLLPPGFYDIALRDFGLALGALSLALLAREFNRPAGKAARGTP